MKIAMGLLFALQAQALSSGPKVMHFKSHFRRFAMGASLVFAGIFLGVMTFAALPLFQLMRREGAWIDQLIVLFFVTVLILYPILALLCFFFEEHLYLERNDDRSFSARGFKKIAIIKWAKFERNNFQLSDLVLENWVGALNAAALNAGRDPQQKRYATKGHWMLKIRGLNGATDRIIERRAKREEIDWLKYSIERHFADDQPKSEGTGAGTAHYPP